MERTYKGSSIIDLPSQYCIIDIETTGLYPEYDNIIEISSILVKDGEIIDKFSSLINPLCEIDDFITNLTGITNDMLSNAPLQESVITDFYNFIGDNILIGHNVHFDINFLYDAMISSIGKPLKNDFIDTLRIARKLYPDMDHHRLSDMACKFNIDYSSAHRAMSDCLITYNCYSKMLDEIPDKELFIKSFSPHYNVLKAKNISTSNTSFNEEHPLYKKVVVFTGTLENMQRKEAMQYVVDLGGFVADNITSKTNFLVLADNIYNTKDGKSNKQKKVEALKLKGNEIDVIPESMFYELIRL